MLTFELWRESNRNAIAIIASTNDCNEVLDDMAQPNKHPLGVLWIDEDGMDCTQKVFSGSSYV